MSRIIILIALAAVSTFARQVPTESRSVTFVNRCADDVHVWKYGVTKNTFYCGATYDDKDAFVVKRGGKITGTWNNEYDIAFAAPIRYTDENPEGVEVSVYDSNGIRILGQTLSKLKSKFHYTLSCENSDDPPEGPFVKAKYDSVYYLCKKLLI